VQNSNPVVRAPSQQMLKATATLKDGVGYLLKARKNISDSTMQYESSHDALNLTYVAIRHIEGILNLARSDVALVHPSMSLARAAMEVSVRALWLVDDNKPFLREQRWIALVKEEIRSRRRADSYLAGKRANAEPQFSGPANLLEDYIKKVEPLIPPDYPPVSRIPTAADMFEALKIKSYAIYVMFSQVVHGTLWATSEFRGGVGNARKLRDRVDENSWYIPLAFAGFTILEPLSRVLFRLGVQKGQVFPRGFAEQWGRDLARVHRDFADDGDTSP
jgi:uncharacterized protein DUF5677